jgi:hypothetical protein
VWLPPNASSTVVTTSVTAPLTFEVAVFNPDRAGDPPIGPRITLVCGFFGAGGVSGVVGGATGPCAANSLCAVSVTAAGIEVARLEVAYRGVKVGSAHMSWIDTDLIRDTKADLPVFREMLAMAPWWPVN